MYREISMTVVHHLNNSRSQRILWALEELGISYEVKRYERDPKTKLAPSALRQIHPLGKSPVITDNGNTVAESGAIIEYLLQTYEDHNLLPGEGSEEKHQYRYWLHFAEGSMMPPLVLRLIFEKITTSPMPFFARPIIRKMAKKVMDVYVKPDIDNNMDLIEDHLGKHEWFAGEQLTGADIQMSFPLEASVARGLDPARYPRICAFVERIHARPAYQRALAKGGSYDYA